MESIDLFAAAYPDEVDLVLPAPPSKPISTRIGACVAARLRKLSASADTASQEWKEVCLAASIAKLSPDDAREFLIQLSKHHPCDFVASIQRASVGFRKEALKLVEEVI